MQHIAEPLSQNTSNGFAFWIKKGSQGPPLNQDDGLPPALQLVVLSPSSTLTSGSEEALESISGWQQV